MSAAVAFLCPQMREEPVKDNTLGRSGTNQETEKLGPGDIVLSTA